MHSNCWLKPHYKYMLSGLIYAELIGSRKNLWTGIRKEHINFYMTCIMIFYVCYMTTVMHLGVTKWAITWYIIFIHSLGFTEILVSIHLIYFSEIDVCSNYLMNIVHTLTIFLITIHFNYAFPEQIAPRVQGKKVRLC